MTTESVLEKLKRFNELILSELYATPEDDAEFRELDFDIKVRQLPRLIAALEMVEERANVKASAEYDRDRFFAREVLAVVNGETKGVVANAMIRCGLDPAAAPLNNADLVAMSGQRFADDVEEPSDKEKGDE